MSILDKFIILFKSEGADKVKRDQSDLKKSNDNIGKSFKETSEEAHKANVSLLSLAKGFGTLIGAGLGLAAVSSNLKSAFDYTKSLDFSSRSLGINIRDLDIWSNAVKKYGGTSEGFVASLKSLSTQLHTSGQVALQTLPDFAETFQKMGRAAAFQYGANLGFDEGTINLLRQGRTELEKIIKAQEKFGTLSKEDAAAAREFNEAWIDAIQAIRQDFVKLETFSFPYLTTALKALTEIAKNLQHPLSYFKGLSADITASSQPLDVMSDLKNSIENLTSSLRDSYRNLIATHSPATVDNINRNFNENIFEPNIQLTLGNFYKAMNNIGNVPMSILTQPTNMGTASNLSKNTTINNGPITIETQATDSEGIAQSFNDIMIRQLRQSNNNFDDGVRI